MSFKDALKTFAQERKLNDDQTALLNTLRKLTPDDLELLREILGPPAKVKVSKGKQTRNMAHCGACGYTRRAAWHKDAKHKDYHEFVASIKNSAVGLDGQRHPMKSARASSIAGRVAGVAGNNKPPLLCDYELDGKVCKGEENDAIHDKSLGYLNYHEFQSEQV